MSTVLSVLLGVTIAVIITLALAALFAISGELAAIRKALEAQNLAYNVYADGVSAEPRRGGPHAADCAYIVTGGQIVCDCPPSPSPGS